MKNYLLSTTRQWNCGDEFILFGISNLLRNANLCIHARLDNLLISSTNDLVGVGNVWNNNAWKPQYSLKAIDEVIVAGTPHYAGPEFCLLFTEVLKANKEIKFVGIGMNIEPNFTDLDIEVLKKASLIIARDDYAKLCCERAGATKVKVLPCPAIMASKEHRITRGNKVGFVYQSDKITYQSISTNLKGIAIKCINKLNCPVICHYVDEYFEALEQFKSVYYSFDAKDYLEYYKRFDIIVSTRLHGAILALSQGTPAILLVEKPNPRLEGAAAQIPVLKLAFSEQEVYESIEKRNLRKWSSSIINFKSDCIKAYRNLNI